MVGSMSCMKRCLAVTGRQLCFLLHVLASRGCKLGGPAHCALPAMSAHACRAGRRACPACSGATTMRTIMRAQRAVPRLRPAAAAAACGRAVRRARALIPPARPALPGAPHPAPGRHPATKTGDAPARGPAALGARPRVSRGRCRRGPSACRKAATHGGPPATACQRP